MKKILTAFSLLTIFASTPSLAEKPSWAGQGKPSAEQKQAYKDDMKDKMQRQEAEIEEKHKAEKKAKKDKGSKLKQDKEPKVKKEKHAEHHKGSSDDSHRQAMPEKHNTERKEAGKGSEQGQAMREEHSRKWWKFWE